MNKARLHKALLSAFPTSPRLAVLLGQRFDRNYATLTAPGPIDIEYWTVLVQAEAEGWLEALARAAHEALPGNPLLADLILEDGLSSAASLATANGSPTIVAGPTRRLALERLVRENSDFVDIATFLERLAALEGQTCRIETDASPPAALGTGFLVGPDLVMTNQHVVAALPPGRRMACRFDHLADRAGVEVHAGITVAPADGWLVTSRPPDPADDSLVETDVPAPENLDFALIRLSRNIGNLPRIGPEGPENPPRGWIGIDPTLKVQAGDDLFILQHPSGSPLKLGVGRLTGVYGGGLRWRHDVATEGGSSGSPVLNRQLALVGLHHAGDPNYFRTALFNQAIPIERIVAWLQGKVDPFWTAGPP